VDDACSAQAIGALRDATAHELSPILETAHRPQRLRKAPPRPYTARACVEALGRLGEDAVPLLDAALRSENEAVALATIRVLDRIGGPAVVMSLQAAVEHHGGEVRRAAETALGDVQARLVGTPGQVSLTTGDTGQVSLAEDGAGQLSLPEKPVPSQRPTAQRRKVVE
jgi:HEAT repeat protein